MAKKDEYAGEPGEGYFERGTRRLLREDYDRQRRQEEREQQKRSRHWEEQLNRLNR